MGIGDAAPQQEDLFGDAGSKAAAEPVLMALHAEYYELIWQGLKTHEVSPSLSGGTADTVVRLPERAGVALGRSH